MFRKSSSLFIFSRTNFANLPPGVFATLRVALYRSLYHSASEFLFLFLLLCSWISFLFLYSQEHTGQFQLMSRQGRFCPRCHVKVDLEWHPQIPCFCLNKDTKVLSNLFICQLFYVIHVPLHHVRHIHLLLLCQAANMSRKRADKSCGHRKIIPFFPGIGQSASVSSKHTPFRPPIFWQITNKKVEISEDT